MNIIPRRLYILCVFLEFLLLIRGTRGTSSIMHGVEGGDVQLRFPYPCEGTKVTLQLRNRHPLFSSLNPNSLNLHLDQIGRLTVVNMQERGICFLQLGITPVMRHDAGTYILLESNLDYIARVGLRVDFPPGQARCTFNTQPFVGDWVQLYCSAHVGTLSGQMKCFQGDMEMPPLSTPSENDDILQQTFLVKKNSYPVFCCSSFLLEPRERCRCNDYSWDSHSNDDSSDNLNPCPDKTVSTTVYPTNAVTSSPMEITSAVQTFKSTHRRIDVNDQKRFRFTWHIYLPIVMIAVLLIGLILGAVRHTPSRWDIMKLLIKLNEGILLIPSNRGII